VKSTSTGTGAQATVASKFFSSMGISFSAMTLKVSSARSLLRRKVVMSDRLDTSIGMTQAMAGPAPCDCPSPGQQTERATFLTWVGRLVHEHRGWLARLARREGMSAEDAFDAVQEALHTFITMPQARALVDDRHRSRALLAALTRNVARNRRRLHAVARPHASDPQVLEGLPAQTASVEEAIAAAEEQIRLAGCLRTLAEVPRTVVTLRMLDEVAGEDVARILGITPGHVAVLLHRAKANLLACMTEDRASAR
jgi:RNA polymerase sigma-70 factor (ECF subfamily)